MEKVICLQGMRGQHANFELHHSDQDLSPSPRTVTQRGLTDGSAVNIRIFTPPKDTQIFDGSPGPQRLVRVQPKELFLLKAIYIKNALRIPASIKHSATVKNLYKPISC